MCSGKSQAEDMQECRRLKTGIVRAAFGRSRAQQGQQGEAGAHAHQAQEADLAVAHLEGALEDAAPGARAQERQQAFGDEQQGDGTEDDVPEAGCGQAPYFLAGAACAPEPRIALKNSLLGSTTIRSLLLRKLAR